MSGTRKIELHLTQREIDSLKYTLENFMDEGPSRSGWQSDELREVRNKVDEALGECREGKE